MITELIDLCNSVAPTTYGRKKELNNKLKTLTAGEFACLFEEPLTTSHRIGAFRGAEPSSTFVFAFASPVPLQRDSEENIAIIEQSQLLCHRLLEKLLASQRFRITDGAVNGRKVEETEYDVCAIGWRITVNIVDIKRIRC
jgi:hypothetical protein